MNTKMNTKRLLACLACFAILGTSVSMPSYAQNSPVAASGTSTPQQVANTEANTSTKQPSDTATNTSTKQASDTAANVNIQIDTSQVLCEISPYIYGVNSGVNMNAVTPGSFRLGGNRLTAYNWENNVSNAGSDYKHHSDFYLTQNVRKELRTLPGAAALEAAATIEDNEIPYGLLTLSMAGYVSSAEQGEVSDRYKVPSKYWYAIENRKNAPFSLTPDTDDKVVYTDEYLNYLFEKVGSSKNGGFQGYALDNEPSLWMYTHSRIQTKPLFCSEFMRKTTDLATTVKDMDENAEVFGPCLFGYMAYAVFTDAPDWQTIKSENNYNWFIDYYLDEMAKAEKADSRRLLDVLDLHYYTEAKGPCGERYCTHYDNDGCVEARINSVRSLYDETYVEDSWITDTGAEFFPLLPKIKESIDTYYPGTKLAFTEYNFGSGDHISGAIAQAEFLGTLAENEAYLATLWSFDGNAFQLSAINMFTNFDGSKKGFGDRLLSSSSDDEKVLVYTANDKEHPGNVRVMLINKSLHENRVANLSLNSDMTFESGNAYGLYGDSSNIQTMEPVSGITDNTLSYTLPPLSIVVLDLQATPPARFPIVPVILGAAVIGAVLVFAMLFITRNKRFKKQGIQETSPKIKEQK